MPDVTNPPAQPPRLLLTVQQSAASLGVGRQKIYDLMDAGDLASVHVGRLRRIPLTALQAYVDRLTATRSDRHDR